MTDAELEKLRQTIIEAQEAIEEEEARRKRLAELGVSNMTLDTSELEKRLDDLIVHGDNQVKLLERLNQVSDMIYKKLEEMSLNLLQLMALGMPLLEQANKK